MLSTPGYAQEPRQPSPPLNSSELLETALNLSELIAAREKIRLQEQALAQNKDLSDRERALAQRELDLQKQLLSIAERERDVEKRRGDELDTLLKLRNKKPGFGCQVKKVLTLGLGRCG